MKKRIILISIFTFLACAAGIVFWGQYRERSADIYYSGTLESTQSHLSFQVAGKVKNVYFDQGQYVKTGQCIAELEQDEFITRKEQSISGLKQAVEVRRQLEISLEILKKTLPADVERANAALQFSAAQLAETEAGNRPQDVERARLSLQEARINLDDAEKDRLRFEDLFRKGFIAEKEQDVAVLKYETALKIHQRAAEATDLVQEGARKEAIAAARAKLSEARALVMLSEGNLRRIEATQADIQVASARIDSARAALDLAEIQLGYTRLLAPFDAMLTSRNVEPGEVVTPGREVITVSDLSRINLKIFVDETEIGKVKPGQKTVVKIDSFPDKIYEGFVSYVSPEGEFTPKIIQTRKERVKLVYLVKIAIQNPDLELKSGMPADAWLR